MVRSEGELAPLILGEGEIRVSHVINSYSLSLDRALLSSPFAFSAPRPDVADVGPNSPITMLQPISFINSPPGPSIKVVEDQFLHSLATHLSSSVVGVPTIPLSGLNIVVGPTPLLVDDIPDSLPCKASLRNKGVCDHPPRTSLGFLNVSDPLCPPPGPAILPSGIFRPSSSSFSSPSLVGPTHLVSTKKMKRKRKRTRKRSGNGKTAIVAPLSEAKGRKFSTLEKIYSGQSSMISKGKGAEHLQGDLARSKLYTKGSGVQLLLNEDWLHEVPLGSVPKCKETFPRFSHSFRQVDELNGKKIIEMGVAMGLDLNNGHFLEKIMASELRDRTREGVMES